MLENYDFHIFYIFNHFLSSPRVLAVRSCIISPLPFSTNIKSLRFPHLIYFTIPSYQWYFALSLSAVKTDTKRPFKICAVFLVSITLSLAVVFMGPIFSLLHLLTNYANNILVETWIFIESLFHSFCFHLIFFFLLLLTTALLHLSVVQYWIPAHLLDRIEKGVKEVEELPY